MQRIVHLCLVFALTLGGCYSLPLASNYPGPSTRPDSIEQYYSRTGTFENHSEELIEKHSDFNIKKIILDSHSGPITIDLYLQSNKSESIILVFPILKGKPIVENYFADYFAKHGFDAAIIRRQNDFMNPDNIDRLEQIIQDNVIRDRYVMDFLQSNYGKTEFGSFGISRGAINAAITAGVDKRLRHNVFVLGGSDLPKLFENSNQRRIKNYINSVTKKKNISKEQFFEALDKNIKTDPKNLASFIDARHTLMVLGVFDRTVPIKYGRILRKQIGNPKTIFLVADHYSSLAFTQILSSLVPAEMADLCIFPFDYVETEALDFYHTSMNTKKHSYKLMPYRMLRLPFDLIGRLVEKVFH